MRKPAKTHCQPSLARLIKPLVLLTFCVGQAQASTIEYDLNFTDSKTAITGSGVFNWNPDSEIMTGLSWTIDGKTGSLADGVLARTYHSYDPLANTYGELFFRYLTAPQAFLIAEYGLLSASNGLMPNDVTSDYFGFSAFGAEKTSSAGTYLFYDKYWQVASQGYVTASAVPLPSAVWLMLSSLLAVGALRKTSKLP